MIALPTSITAAIAEADVTVRVALTAHAVERYVERVQSCADFAFAVSRIARLFSLGVVAPRPAEWDATQLPAPL